MGFVTPMACVWVPAFVAAAAVRAEPSLAERPLAVLRGTPPAARVVAVNLAAHEHGVEPEMTEATARARCPGLVTRPLEEALVASARHALLEAALAVSPRLEDAAPGLVHVDLAGLERLLGSPAAIGERLLRQARAVGLDAHVGVGSSRTVARVAAQAGRRLTVVPPGQERAFLDPAPITILDLPGDVRQTLEGWGIGTLGALAALPREGVGTRLGPAGLRAHDLARGLDPEPFTPWTPPPFWEEAQDLAWEVETLDGLLPPLGRVIERLGARLEAAHVAADTLGLQLHLVSGVCHARTVALAYPTREPKLLLGLVRLSIEAHPPDQPVVGVAVSVRPVAPESAQGVLGRPMAPAHRDLAALLARLVTLVGADNLGSPVLVDSHHPDAFTLARFSLTSGRASTGSIERKGPRPTTGPAAPRSARIPDARLEAEPRQGQGDDPFPRDSIEAPLVLRRLRPPREVEVEIESERPGRVRWAGTVYRVVASAGPWRATGEWWDARGWARDEWDVLLGDGTLGRLARDTRSGRWLLDGVYD